MTTPAEHHLPPLRALAVGLHALVVGLLVVAVVRVEPPRGAALAAGALMLIVYAVGAATRVSRGSAGRWLWTVALLATWVGLLATTVDAVWLAFPLFFVFLHLLPRVPGLLAVAATTAAAVAAYGLHDGVTPASVIGPLIGAGVANGTVLGYEALLRESAQRQALIEELQTTRQALAGRERDAGAHAERERLAREIHDTLAQGLTSIQLLLRAAERDVRTDPASAGERLALARETAQVNLDEARRFVRALPPPGLENGSVTEALRRLATQATDRSEVAVLTHVAGDEQPLPAGVAAAVLRIAQSAIGNAVEHSGASTVAATVTFMDDEVALDVVDDGVGFAPDSVVPDRDRGHGLSVMRSRAEAEGGRLSVESSPGSGTAVAATFPLERS
jgi:signal transduction histidine kinase